MFHGCAADVPLFALRPSGHHYDICLGLIWWDGSGKGSRWPRSQLRLFPKPRRNFGDFGWIPIVGGMSKRVTGQLVARWCSPLPGVPTQTMPTPHVGEAQARASPRLGCWSWRWWRGAGGWRSRWGGRHSSHRRRHPRYVRCLWSLGCYDMLHVVECGRARWSVQVTDGQWLTGRQSVLAVRSKNCCMRFIRALSSVHKTLTTWAQFQNILLPYKTVYIHTVVVHGSRRHGCHRQSRARKK